MKPKILIFTLYVTGFLTTAPACTDDMETDNPQSSQKYPLSTENLLFYADDEKYRQTNANREKDAFCQLDFEIQGVQRNKNKLAIHIVKPVDCNVKYEIVWNGALMESFPMQANIFVRALGSDCGQEGRETEVLNVDLEKTFKNLSSTEIENTIFHVMDACSLQDFPCQKDCDVRVSKEGI